MKTFTFIASSPIDNLWAVIEVKARNEQNAERVALFTAIAVEGFTSADIQIILVPTVH